LADLHLGGLSEDVVWSSVHDSWEHHDLHVKSKAGPASVCIARAASMDMCNKYKAILVKLKKVLVISFTFVRVSFPRSSNGQEPNIHGKHHPYQIVRRSRILMRSLHHNYNNCLATRLEKFSIARRCSVRLWG
jgi:hypothetical protein